MKKEIKDNSVEKVLLEILQNSRPATFLKKRQVFSCEFCEIYKNTLFYGTPPWAASDAERERERKRKREREREREREVIHYFRQNVHYTNNMKYDSLSSTRISRSKL